MSDLEKPVHLYEKTHNQTGLKYFGRTVEDPHAYRGSGEYWTRHLDAYGDDVSTKIVGTFTDPEALKSAAEAYSTTNQVMTSTNYANLLSEDGGVSGAGWKPGTDHSERIAALDTAVQQANLLRGLITPGARNVPAGDRRFG